MSSLTEFYREEFIKHQQCLQAQREFYSEQAIERVEAALVRIISEMDHLTRSAGADQLVENLLREFDVVTGLSGWTDPQNVH